jgi:hypothetical protein
VDQAFLDGGELFAPTEAVLDLSDQGIERLARGGAPVKPFKLTARASFRSPAGVTAPPIRRQIPIDIRLLRRPPRPASLLCAFGVPPRSIEGQQETSAAKPARISETAAPGSRKMYSMISLHI